MKLKKSLFMIPLLLTSFFFLGCPEKDEAVAETTEEELYVYSSSDYAPGLTGDAYFDNQVSFNVGTDNKVSYDSMVEYFNPPYDPESPDEINKPAAKTKTEGSKTAKPSESVIPGLRDLKKYKTVYNPDRQTVPAPVKPEEPLEEDDNADEPFRITDWGPTAIVSENTNPTLYVMFNKPVIAITTLGEPSSKSDIMTITPPLKGVFRWYGSKHLSFEASEPADPSISYTITVKNNLKSLSGKQITGDTVFKTKVEPVQILSIYGGYEKENTCHYDSSTGALPPYENKFLIRFNYLLQKEAVEKVLIVDIDGKTVAYTAEPAYTYDYPWSYSPKFDETEKKSNSYIVTIKDSVPHNATVKASINGSDTNAYRSFASYKTLRPFTVNINDYADYSQGNKSNPISIYFSQVPNKKTIAANLSVNGINQKITDDNIEVYGRHVTLYGLKLDFNTKYELVIGSGIKDAYGQPLKNPGTFSFRTRDVQSYVRYIDYGMKMMEAKYPHRIIYEYQNAYENSFYEVKSIDNPYQTNRSYNADYWNEPIAYVPETATAIDTEKRNQRNFVDIDLNPYLKNGYGFVKFEAHTNLKGYRWYDDSDYIYDSSNVMTVQVTDLGITSRIGLNKAVIMIRSLSTGKPVSNATVSLYYRTYDGYYITNDNTRIATGTSDSNGLCVINFTEEQIRKFETGPDYYSDRLAVYVENGDDKAVYTADSHSSWRDGVPTYYTTRARQVKQRTFIFVDRGLYKPGETVTFRGIDRDQVLGSLKAHQSGYSINVKGSWWGASDIIPTIRGESSESGGFYGSFQLPEEMDSGYYTLSFYRDGSDQKVSIEFTVANFERLKIQASVSIPEMPYYGGDNISAQLEASYLAGGALSGANYEATWYKQLSRFNPTTPETKGFMFGPQSWYSSKNFYSESEGSLNSNGTTNISCTTQEITDGNPYVYRLEANVTDVSNQRITAQGSILVHPAQYYFGIRRAKNVSSFAKKGQKLEFPYIIVNADGKKVSETFAAKNVTNVEYTLSREVWTMVHEDGVDNGIYARYEQSTVVDAKQSFTPKNSGTLEVTPKESGWYTLTITGKDIKGHTVKTNYEFYVTGGNSFWYDRYNSQSISLTPDQNQYNPGDTARILLESPLPKGDYLITVEREGIFTEEVKHFDSSANVIEVPISGNYVPVVYVSVSSYSERNGEPEHKYGEPDLDKPKGYYGVTPVFVNPYVRAFSVSMEADKTVYKPGEEVTVTLKATKGGAPVSGAEITFMAVDRGVLDLINYHVPNPIEFFYAKENYPLYVKGGDSRGYLMDPVTYNIKNLTGGDSDEEEKEEERKDFKPTAVFEPALITGKDGTVTCKFKMPDTLTTYRLTAFGVRNDSFALQEDELKVQNPINIQQVQPRRLRERDTAECGVLITNLQNKGFEVSVSLEVRSPTKNTVEDEEAGRITVPGEAFVDGTNSNKVYVAPGDSTVVYFDVAAKSAGTVELVYTIKSDVLNEKLVSPIKIERTYVYETVTTIGQSDNSKTGTMKEGLAIPSWAKNGRGDLRFTLDTTRLGSLGSSVNYLFAYPYGCMEQQSSRVLPLIIFGDYIDVFGLNSQVSNVKACVTSFTKSWKNSQYPSGGFPYWPNESRPGYESFYVSTRIAHIYAIGKMNGYKDKDLGYDIKKLASYLRSNINSTWVSDYQKVYCCYVLNLLGEGNSTIDGIVNNYATNAEKYSLSVNAMTGLALDAKGDKSGAQKLVKEVKNYIQPSERSVTVTSKHHGRTWYWYNTSTDEYALILQLLVSVNPKDEMVDKLISTIMTQQTKGYWQSTATTTQVLNSIYTYIKKRDLDSTDLTASVELNKKEIMKESFKGVNAKPKVLTLPFEDKAVSSLPKDKVFPVTFKKDGTGWLFYTMELKYALPDEMQNARDEGLKVDYFITDYETGELMNPENKKNSEITLESGKVYKATVNISSPRHREYVALRCPIPSGAEILDSTFVTSGSDAMVSSNHGWWSNTNVLDNEVQYFWDDLYSGSRTVTFTFRTSRRGVYPTPPVQSECMYEEEIFGRSDGYLIKIK